MDIVLLTDTRSGLNAQPVRITSIEENENGDLTFEGEEISIGTGFIPPPPVTVVVDSMNWGVPNSDTIDSSVGVPANVSLSTTTNNSLLVAAICNSRGTSAISPVTSVSSTSGLTWTLLHRQASVMPGFPNHINVEVWTALAPTPVTNEFITFHLPAVVPANACAAIAIENVSSTLDGSALDNIVATNGSGKPSVTMTTTNANDIIIYVLGAMLTTNLGTPTGFTYDDGQSNSFSFFSGTIRINHQIVSSTQTGLVLTPATGTNQTGICIAFALQE
jgi:hypothetical protein